MNKLTCKVLSSIGLISSALISPQVYAFDLLVNGFGTVCASKSDLQKYASYSAPLYPSLPAQLAGTPAYTSTTTYSPSYDGAQRRWSFLPNSKFGLQFSSLFNDKFKAVVQLIGRWEAMTDNHYSAKMDWAYLQYNTTNDLDFQFGRFRLPSFYYSDYLDVNHAQPWIIAPEEVYFIVGGAFRNMDGIKARYAYYLGDWTINSKFWFGSMEEQLSILNNEINVSVKDVTGAQLQIGNDYFSLQGSIMRSIYDTSLYDGLQGLVSYVVASQGQFQAANNLNSYLQQNNVPIIYLGFALSASPTDNLDLLFERASILSRGIISTAREGWYGSLTYSFLEQYSLTFTYGFSRPLKTEMNKYFAVSGFFNSPQYLAAVDNTNNAAKNAGQATINLFQTYLGEQRSYALDARYDILPSLALKGGIKCVTPIGQKGFAQRYILNRVATNKHIWVYRLSLDFVF